MKKICTKCKENKPLNDFYKDISRKDNRQLKCKNCRKIYYENNKQQIQEYQKNYYEKNRQKTKIYYIENKQKILENQKNYRVENKQQISEYKTKYYENNKQQVLDQQRKYSRTDKGKLIRVKVNHSRRAREAASIKDFTTKESKIVMFLQNYRCAWCGEYFDIVKPTLDHINPVSKGGDLIKENVQYLCQKHNSEKGVQKIDYRTQFHKDIISIYQLTTISDKDLINEHKCL